MEDGLPVNSVRDIIQDEHGYMFFATLNGLVRYNGYEFTVFNAANSPGMISDRINHMSLSPDNEIWMISENGNLMRYQDGKITSLFHPSKESAHFNDFAWDSAGVLWVTSGNELLKLNPVSNKLDVVAKLDAARTISGMIIEQDIILLTDDGLYHFTDQKLHHHIKREDFPSIFTGNYYSFRNSGNNLYWVIKEQDFFVFDILSKKLIYDSNDQFAEIQVFDLDIRNKNYLISTNQGYFELNLWTGASKRLFDDDSFPPFSSTTMATHWSGRDFYLNKYVIVDDELVFETERFRTGFVAKDGSIWVASDTEGLYQLRENIFTNITRADLPGMRNTYSIVERANGELWAASFTNGLFRFSKDGIDNFNEGNSSLFTNVSRYLFEDSNGELYISTWGQGLMKFQDNTLQEVIGYRHLLDSKQVIVEAMHRDQKGDLYIGNRGKMLVKTGNKFKTMSEHRGVNISGVRVIRENEQGTLFLGTMNDGLYLLRADGSSHHLTTNVGLSSNRIRDIYLQAEDTLWLATENNGLNRVILGGKNNVAAVDHVLQQNGLISSALHRIVEDPYGNLWVSSNGGLMTFNKELLNQYADGNLDYLQVDSFTEVHGISNREFNGGVNNAGALLSDSLIMFPNQDGLVVVDPQKYHQSLEIDYGVPPVFEQLYAEDGTYFIQENQPIRLKESQRNFTLKFSAPNFVNPNRVIYQYRLSGVNANWLVANELREASFTNVPPGNHTFEVQTIWGNGKVTTAAIPLNIAPHFYETWVFRVLVFLSLIAGGYGMYVVRTRQLKDREKKLQQRVQEQTAQLVKAAEQKSRFFAGITHELKTPLSLISSPLEDLLDNNKVKSAPQIQQRLQLMHRNSDRLKNLVNQVLDVSKLNADAIQLRIAPANLEQLTRQVIGQFHSRLKQEKLRFKSDFDPELPPIYVDKEAWERILFNLVSNAIKYSPAGSEIYLAIRNYPDHVGIYVKDQGPGIPLEEQERIFDYLYQVEGLDSAGGTGIGLYLVKGLVERMHGSVAIQSEPGKGSEFMIELQKGFQHFDKSEIHSHEVPTMDNLPAKPANAKPADDTETSSAKNQGEQILIVEDNTDFRAYVKSLLSQEYQVAEAKNGEEALAILQDMTPNLIISDIMMPTMNGYEFVGSLRQREDFEHLPVIFLSAKDTEEDIETGLSTGADVFLSKPISSKMLLAQVKAVLRRERILRADSSLSPKEPDLVAQVKAIIYRQLANPSLNVDGIADLLFISRTKLYRDWKKVSDTTINDLIKELRMNEAKDLLESQGFNVQEAARAVGYTNSQYFSTSFKKKFGVSPSEMKKA